MQDLHPSVKYFNNLPQYLAHMMYNCIQKLIVQDISLNFLPRSLFHLFKCTVSKFFSHLGLTSKELQAMPIVEEVTLKVLQLVGFLSPEVGRGKRFQPVTEQGQGTLTLSP